MRTIADSPQQARVGLLKNVELFSSKLAKFYPDLVGQTISTKQDYEELGTISDFDVATPVAEGAPITYQDIVTPYTKRLYVLMRAIGFQISMQAEYTDLYGKVSKPSKGIALAFEQTIEALVANIINNCTATSTVGPDGVALASASHLSAGAVQSNYTSGAGTALSPTSAATAMKNFMRRKTHKGNVMAMPGPYLVLVPPDLKDLAFRIFESDLQAVSANNDKNYVRTQVKGIHSNPYFTSTTLWGLLDPSNNPIIHLKRIARFAKEEFDNDTLSHKFVVGQEDGVWFEDWRGFEFNAGA